jgi:NAD(P)-dependent dehydrogenase (short-subunit alcohol dehydrogenase family)
MTTRVAIGTGARQGIGQAIAIDLARRGARVALVDLKPSEETAARIVNAANQGVYRATPRSWESAHV